MIELWPRGKRKGAGRPGLSWRTFGVMSGVFPGGNQIDPFRKPKNPYSGLSLNFLWLSSIMARM